MGALPSCLIFNYDDKIINLPPREKYHIIREGNESRALIQGIVTQLPSCIIIELKYFLFKI